MDDQPVGLIALTDLPNPQSKAVIDELQQSGIRTVMITGDSQAAGQAIGDQLGVDQVAANVLPENKAQIIQQLQNEYGQTVMVGDGINDAPALVQADIGFAMGKDRMLQLKWGCGDHENDLTRFTYALKTAKTRSDYLAKYFLLYVYCGITDRIEFARQNEYWVRRLCS